MTLRQWLEEQPFTLSLTSAFFGFFSHIGFVKALEQEGLFPKAYTGASAGAFISAAHASGLRAKEMEEMATSIQLKEFWDPGFGVGYVRGQKLEAVLAKFMKSTFSELEKPLHIATFDIARVKTKIFTEGNLPLIARASAAVPVLFHPVKIDGRYYWDGGTRDKMGIAALDKNERILCHYLQGDLLIDRFERLLDQAKAGPQTQMVRLQKIPNSGPTKLHLGKEIIDVTFRQTLQRLDQNI